MSWWPTYCGPASNSRVFSRARISGSKYHATGSCGALARRWRGWGGSVMLALLERGRPQYAAFRAAGVRRHTVHGVRADARRGRKFTGGALLLLLLRLLRTLLEQALADPVHGDDEALVAAAQDRVAAFGDGCL